jgi:DNA repair exonuclease SbcCD ATPase subunit
MGRPGRPPLGERAMTPAEKMRRYRARKFGNKPRVTRSAAAALKARIRELEAALEAKGKGVAPSSASARRQDNAREVDKLSGEITKLKSDILKLKAALQEEPDAAKLREKVAEQQAQMASLRTAMKQIAKERDKYQARTSTRKYGEARRLLTRETYAVIVKALHPDRAKHVLPAELAEAGRVFVHLKPLFDEG